MRTILYCGMDVHKDTVVVAVLEADATEPTRIVKLMHEPRPVGGGGGTLTLPSVFLLACYQ